MRIEVKNLEEESDISDPSILPVPLFQDNLIHLRGGFSYPSMPPPPPEKQKTSWKSKLPLSPLYSSWNSHKQSPTSIIDVSACLGVLVISDVKFKNKAFSVSLQSKNNFNLQ